MNSKHYQAPQRRRFKRASRAMRRALDRSRGRLDCRPNRIQAPLHELVKAVHAGEESFRRSEAEMAALFRRVLGPPSN